MPTVMLVGPVGAGKTTLIHAINNDCRKAAKTQSICFCDSAIDTPGEYAQIPKYYSALMVTAMEASIVAIVQDATNFQVTLPPGFASMFSRKVIGVVTKVDLPGADKERARLQLFQAGIKEPVFFVSAHSGEGLEDLINYVAEGRDNV